MTFWFCIKCTRRMSGELWHGPHCQCENPQPERLKPSEERQRAELFEVNPRMFMGRWAKGRRWAKGPRYGQEE